MARKFDVTKATPIDTHVRIALVGSAGSGKTFSALRLATGFGGKIVLIDTENRRSAKYSKRFDFQQIDFQPPFNPASYGDAIDAAVAAGADTIIIDSMSHEHEGEGGVLEMAEDFLEKRAGQDYKKREQLKFASWIAPKRERTQLIVGKIQRLPVNIILCFRAKEVTKPVRNGQGKIEPIKEWDMIGGDEYRYEMDVTMFLPSGSDGVPDWNNSMKRVNDADGALRAFLVGSGQITEDVGRKIKKINGLTGDPTHSTQTPEAVSQPTGQTVEPVTSDIDLKLLARSICTLMSNAKTDNELYDIWTQDAVEDIEKIKTASQSAFDFMKGVYDKKMDEIIKERDQNASSL